jgi:serine/threonine-protein kinase
VATTSLLDDLRAALPARITVDRDLRSGGQGSVFVGAVEGRPAAVKVFRPGDERRVARELDLLRAIKCPHLVEILANEQIRLGGVDHTVVAYEFHPGGDLERLIAPGAAQVTEGDLIQIGLQVGTAVDALWAARIVHRDIKPANVVRAADGRYVLVDVGLARHLDRSDLTAVGFTVGTHGYMAPEHYAGRRSLTIHADAFSLGVTLYELAALKHPFDRNQVRIMTGPPPVDLATVRPDLSPAIRGAIHRMMSPMASVRPRALAAFFAGFSRGI